MYKWFSTVEVDKVLGGYTNFLQIVCPVLKVDLFFEVSLLSYQLSYNTWLITLMCKLQLNLNGVDAIRR